MQKLLNLSPKLICMKSQLLRSSIALLVVTMIGFALPACRSYCPGVDGTGNSASRQSRLTLFPSKAHCPAVAGTGNYKPKVKNKKEDGLTSPKMERQMAKAANKKAGPLESKKLHFD
jgi:hypothetical protein